MNIRNAIISYQGYTESRRTKTDTERLYTNLIRSYSCPAIHTRFPEDWTANVKEIVDQLERNGLKNLFITFFSHGQAAAMATASYAVSLGIKVSICGCDPVYRPTWLPRATIFQPFAFRALMKTGTIKVPKGVDRCSYIRQQINRPMGHTLIASDNHTEIECLSVLPYIHTDIDGSKEWFGIVEREIDRWITKI